MFDFFLSCDSPTFRRQDAATILLLEIYKLHDIIIFWELILGTIVFWIFFSVIFSNSRLTFTFQHGNTIEFIWTCIPAIILWIIGLPSLHLLYLTDNFLNTDLTIKVIGNQWYWSYEYSDYEEIIKYDSFILDDSSLQLGDLRLLETDNSLILPIHSVIRLLITSTDVIHSFTVPSLGFKADAIPGRLNSVNFSIFRPGSFYGQCSELCGVLHGFMPISVKGVSKLEYLQFIKNELNSPLFVLALLSYFLLCF